MHHERLPNRRPPDQLVDTISNASVRGFYDQMMNHLDTLNEGVVVCQSDVDVRAEFDGRLICRIVPYRDLLHLQIGDSPTWEIRVRDEGGYMEAMGRILEIFLRLAAGHSGAQKAPAEPQSGLKPR